MSLLRVNCVHSVDFVTMEKCIILVVMFYQGGSLVTLFTAAGPRDTLMNGVTLKLADIKCGHVDMLNSLAVLK